MPKWDDQTDDSPATTTAPAASCGTPGHAGAFCPRGAQTRCWPRAERVWFVYYSISQVGFLHGGAGGDDSLLDSLGASPSPSPAPSPASSPAAAHAAEIFASGPLTPLGHVAANGAILPYPLAPGPASLPDRSTR